MEMLRAGSVGLPRAIAALLLTAALFALFTTAGRAGAAPADTGQASALIAESVRRLSLQTEIDIGEMPKGWRTNFRLKIPREAASVIFYGSLFVIFSVVMFRLRDNLWSFSRSRDARTRRTGFYAHG
jgi:purine nucleoside permease